MSERTCLGLATWPLQASVMTVGPAQVQGHDYHYIIITKSPQCHLSVSPQQG